MRTALIEIISTLFPPYCGGVPFAVDNPGCLREEGPPLHLSRLSRQSSTGVPSPVRLHLPSPWKGPVSTSCFSTSAAPVSYCFRYLREHAPSLRLHLLFAASDHTILLVSLSMLLASRRAVVLIAVFRIRSYSGASAVEPAWSTVFGIVIDGRRARYLSLQSDDCHHPSRQADLAS